jgi:RNA polymerase sigma factor (sigma-70 family)
MSEFGQLIEQEIPRLRRYARALTRDIEKADDLVQSCLMRALTKERLWQPDTNLRAWLFTVLHNVHINDVRRSIREQGSAIAGSAPVALAQCEPSACLDLGDVERAIGKLPEPQRRVILLIGLEGMSYDEAAAILGVPAGTVRSRIARARNTLRKLLEYDIKSTAAFDGSSLRARAALPALHPEPAPRYALLPDIAQRSTGKWRRLLVPSHLRRLPAGPCAAPRCYKTSG